MLNIGYWILDLGDIMISYVRRLPVGREGEGDITNGELSIVNCQMSNVKWSANFPVELVTLYRFFFFLSSFFSLAPNLPPGHSGRWRGRLD